MNCDQQWSDTRRKRILFVDDASYVLVALKRMLRSLAEEWEMVFMDSSLAAFDAAREKPFDVVVADMHMPEMSGEELLSNITAMQPGTIGFILSGDTDDRDPRDGAPLAFPFIPKPCSAERIRQAIGEALRVTSQVA